MTPRIGDFKTEQSFQLMVESVVDYALFMLDREGRIATWNRGAERIKLYRADEIIGRHFSIFYPQEMIENGFPERELTLALQNGRHEDEGWRLRKNGTRFWANVVITALWGSNGELVGFGKVTRDLSERKRAEQGLAVAYDQLNSVLDCTSDLVMKVNKNWTITYGNSKAAMTIPDFFIGRNYWDCFPAVRGTELENKLLNAMEHRSETFYETYYVPYQRWYRGTIFPAFDGLSIFFADVTEEKALQEKLERARYLKERHIEALSHMAGGLAHEINNPLAIIHATAADLLTSTAPGRSIPVQEVKAACEIIVKTSDRAMRILRGLRGFGRQADNDPMETASIYEIVDQAIELQGARFERHKIDFRLELKPALPYIVCRAIQIGQIITNLLNNAFDAVVQANVDKRWVMLSVERWDRWLHVDVTDGGPPINEDVKTHLMEPLFTTKEGGLGMGVGLSLSRAIAAAHGGTLMLCPNSPRTHFRLTVPIAPASELLTSTPGLSDEIT